MIFLSRRPVIAYFNEIQAYEAHLMPPSKSLPYWKSFLPMCYWEDYDAHPNCFVIFDSMSDCARFFGIDRSTVAKIMKNAEIKCLYKVATENKKGESYEHFLCYLMGEIDQISIFDVSGSIPFKSPYEDFIGLSSARVYLYSEWLREAKKGLRAPSEASLKAEWVRNLKCLPEWLTY